MAARRCYRTEEAIVFILEPGSDSEMSDLKNSDDETDEAYIPPNLRMKVIVIKFLMKAIVVEILIKTKTIKMIMIKIVTLRN